MFTTKIYGSIIRITVVQVVLVVVVVAEEDRSDGTDLNPCGLKSSNQNYYHFCIVFLLLLLFYDENCARHTFSTITINSTHNKNSSASWS